MTEIEKSIKEQCTDDIAKEYIKNFGVDGDILYECKTLFVYGTEYKHEQYVIIQGTTLESPVFGKISKLLCCKSQAYLIVQMTSNFYCKETDLFFLKDEKKFELIPTYHLAAFHPIESYLVSDAQQDSLSLRHYVLEHLN